MVKKYKIKIFAQNNSEFLKKSLEQILPQNFSIECSAYDSVIQDSFNNQDVDVAVFLPDNKNIKNGAGISEEVQYWQTVWNNFQKIEIIQIGYDYDIFGSEGLHISTTQNGFIQKIRLLNQKLAENLPKNSYFLDLDAISGFFGKDKFYENRNYCWFKQPFSEEGCLELAKHISVACKTILFGSKKVLILDLDNTLWGGIVAEDGFLNVKIGEDSLGEAYLQFQKHCKNLSERGILLAIASKNNENDAKEPFIKNNNMILQLDDFADFVTGWYPKSSMIKQISEDLNLSADSFVFFDDNPVEREEVRVNLPEVYVVDVPDEPTCFIRELEKCLCFETVAITKDDTIRAQQYRSEKLRKSDNFKNVDEFLKSLEMEAEIVNISDENMGRISQLVLKTNQFNLTVKRHSVSEITEILNSENSICFALKLKDKFGDLGICSLILAKMKTADIIEIDTFLQSCRVINRSVEQYVMNNFMQKAKEQGYKIVEGFYSKTSKNALVADLYQKFGFVEKENKFIYQISDFKNFKTHIK